MLNRPRSLRSSLVVIATLVMAVAPFAVAQNAPLQLFKNYLVTGDYVVGGVGLRGLGQADGYAHGIIRIPDGLNGPGGAAQPNAGTIPNGADIVAAFLYWQTVESSQSAFAGQVGFFNGYQITGQYLPNPSGPVSWSSGGCVGSSSGTKSLKTYRADVRPYLALDANGEVVGNGSYPVLLADSGSNGGGVPLTFGATLVIVYRVLSPNVPLAAISIYDGTYAPNNSAQIMSQTLQGIYQADKNPTVKLTQIVGNGQPNKLETAAINGGSLPSLYTSFFGSSAPAFPGFYNGSWDTATWNVSSGVVAENAASASTSVSPSSSNSGCVVWGAEIIRANVKDTDKDGLLDTWEDFQGYTDINSGQFVSLPGANKSVKDMFIEVDYLKNLDGSAGPYLHSHLPKQAALDAVGNAFKNAPVDCTNKGCSGIKVHFDVGNVYQSAMAGGPSVACGTSGTGFCDPYIITNGTGGNGVAETALLCSGSSCAFPDVPTLGWKGGLLFVKNNATDPNTGIPLGNFQLGRALSYRYVLFGHALGVSRSYWGASVATPTSVAGKLVSIGVTNNVGTVTIQSKSVNFLKPGDPVGPNDPASLDKNLDRVTIEGALAQTTLNGTYAFSGQSTGNPDASGNVTTTFTIATSKVPDGTYTVASERWLGVAYGGPTTSSGHSDLGGADSAVTFGLWPADDPTTGCQHDPSLVTSVANYCNDEVGSVLSQAGTLLHELGHPLTLTHGGAYYPNANNSPSAPPSYGLNCKPNFLSVMNYLFQVRGFPDGGVDYSGQVVAPLGENALNEVTGLGSSPAPAHLTRWYAPPSTLDTMLGNAALTYCDGTPIPGNADHLVRVDGVVGSTYTDWNNDYIQDSVNPQDVNFDGTVQLTAHPGFNDWASIDLRQIGARANAFGFSGSGSADIRGGSADIRGGSADIRGGSADIRGGAEVDFRLVNSSVDVPTGLTATWNKGTKSVDLKWNAPVFGQIRSYKIYRLLGVFNPTTNPLTNAVVVKTITYDSNLAIPLPTAYSDTTVKTNQTYTYFVTSNLGDTDGNRQSGPSNRAQVTTK